MTSESEINDLISIYLAKAKSKPPGEEAHCHLHESRPILDTKEINASLDKTVIFSIKAEPTSMTSTLLIEAILILDADGTLQSEATKANNQVLLTISEDRGRKKIRLSLKTEDEDLKSRLSEIIWDKASKLARQKSLSTLK